MAIAQPKNWVLVNPKTKGFLVSFSDKKIRDTKELSEAWISNHDTLLSVQGYVNAVHEIKYALMELGLEKTDE